MKFNVGDSVRWDGHDARIGAIMEHPPRYIIEYTVRQSDVSGTITHSYGRTKIVKEDEVTPVDAERNGDGEVAPFAQALSEANQRELELRNAFIEATDKTIARVSNRASLRVVKAAQDQYVKALVTLHQAAKRS